MTMTIASSSTDAQPDVIAALSQALSETAVETCKAQIFHWNVTGIAFAPLHALFQEIYDDHFAAQDTLAERIRALGGHADGRMSVAVASSAIEECDGRVPAREMISRLAADQETLSATLGRLARLADECDDLVTNDLAIARAEAHDKFAWMLRAHLSE